MAKRLTKEELAARYPDEDWRQRFVQVSQLTDFLNYCIISDKYKVPDQLNNAVKLDDQGSKLVQELVKQGVPPKEARLMCLLELAHVDPLVDVDEIDIPELQDAISRQVVAGDIRFPFVFGRQLYDRAAELFEVQRSSLTMEETFQLLEGTPQGVFQLGQFVSGPYGILISRMERFIPPTRRVPLFSCSDFNCSDVHSCAMSTGWDAPINDHRPKLTKLLQQINTQKSEWDDFVGDLVENATALYNDFSLVTLPYLLGDGLADDELRVVAEYLLDNTSGKLRSSAEILGIPTGSAARMTAQLERANLLQLLLLCSDDELSNSLDVLVAADKIRIPLGEVRRPVVNRGRRGGRFGVQVQMGAYGLRVEPFDPTVATMRLRRLVDSLFEVEDATHAPELEWQLRGVDAPTIDSKLEQYLRTRTPREVLERLVLATRSNVIAACTELGVDEHQEQADNELVDAMLWKLGFSVGDDRSPNQDFWTHYERMDQLVRTAGVSPLVDQDDLRARGVNFFVKLEGALEDSLSYTAWALTTDHYASRTPFVFQPEADRVTALSWLNSRHIERNGPPEPGEPGIAFGDKNTLYALCRGFGFLSDELEAALDAPDQFLRPEQELPEFVQHTSLQQFPFLHRMPFLDLLPQSRKRVLDALRNASRLLVDARVSEVRNEQLHFRRSLADLEKLNKVLMATRTAIQTLEESGFTRMPYTRVSMQRDAWGRLTYVLQDAHRREIAFVQPTAYDWMRLPPLNGRQYVMTAAQFAEPNAVLRFQLGFASEYARMWDDFPRRRKHTPSLLRTQTRQEARGTTTVAGAAIE